MLKCQFHCHSSADPVDAINYSSRHLINEAARLQYDVISITCHRHREFNKELKQYAATKGILLIPGIEFEINKKHILGINIDESIYDVHSFDDLRHFRFKNPQSLIIAPHPFFPGPSLKEDFTQNLDCFDAVEYSWAYTQSLNFNDKAIKIAKDNGLPVVATSDCHVLDYLDEGYCSLDCDKDIAQIIQSVKEGKAQNYHKVSNYPRIARSISQVAFQTIRKKLKK